MEQLDKNTVGCGSYWLVIADATERAREVVFRELHRNGVVQQELAKLHPWGIVVVEAFLPSKNITVASPLRQQFDSVRL